MPKTFLLTALCLAATGPMAQEAATTSHEIEAAFTWSGVDAAPTMPMGDGQEAFVSESLLVISSTEGPLAGLAGRCFQVGVTDLATMGSQDSGFCVYHDANGDQLWESIESTPEGGRATWTGGTGRFEGASGEITYETTFSASPRAGVYQGTGMKRGTLVLAGS